MSNNLIELLSPAGSFDCAISAFTYGADAVYLGLKQFSARADAINFSINELFDIVKIAHGLNKKVYVAVNTLIQNSEIQDVVNQLSIINSADVDAIIIQDFGVIQIVKKYFPKLCLHASTQMAVHNLDGALALKDFGFSRVVLARELTFDEINNIVKKSGIEIEVFIHGALCYSYSGLCMYSSFETGHSANRGSCSYPCRRLCGNIHPYSMKDLSLGNYILKLKDIGVASLKIEGRKKSPLYVAATADYYHRILNNKNTDDCLKNIQKIFARPYTDLHFNGKNTDVIDKYFCGPRGVLIGHVEQIKNSKIKFKTTESIEKHDGILITVEKQEKPFGFSVDKMFINNKFTFTSKSGDIVELKLPDKYPNIKKGDAIYCSSSNKVKSLYPINLNLLKKQIIKPKIDVIFEMTDEYIKISWKDINISSFVNGTFTKSNNFDTMKQGVINSLSKIGDSNYNLGEVDYRNPGYFAPISVLNSLRRDFVKKLNDYDLSCKNFSEIEIERLRKMENIQQTDILPRYIIKVDDIGYLKKFSQSDIDEIFEFILDVNCDITKLNIPTEKIRISLPIIYRDKNNINIKSRIRKFIDLGVKKFSIANIYGFQLIKMFNIADFICDFYLYSMNDFSIQFLFEKGANRVTISPEDNLQNINSILDVYQNKVDLIVYADIPLFISDNPSEHDNRTKLNDDVIIKDNVNYVFDKKTYCIIENIKSIKECNLRLDFC